MKRANIEIIWLQKEIENAKDIEIIFKEVTENFPSLDKAITI